VIVAAPDDSGVRPMSPQALGDVLDDGPHLSALGGARRAQDRHHRGAARHVTDVHRCEAALVVMGVPERKLLSDLASLIKKRWSLTRIEAASVGGSWEAGPWLFHAERVRGSTGNRGVPSGNGRGRYVMWASATWPVDAGSKGRRLSSQPWSEEIGQVRSGTPSRVAATAQSR
jgi:hypothetical protein